MKSKDVEPEKSLRVCSCLCVFLGWTGAHHYYLGKPFLGTVYLLTCGLFGVGWLFDICRLSSLVEHYRRDSTTLYRRRDDVLLLTVCLGFTGIQHFVLRRYLTGFYYLLTFGGFGLGWLVDIFRIGQCVDEYNEKLKVHARLDTDHSLVDAYLYCIPLGLLGLHHFYLGRPRWGLFYMFTLGNFGVGWLIDLVRMRKLVEQASSQPIVVPWDVWDAFILWCPLGIFGAHWLYLGHPKRGLSYTFTLGYLCVGWIVDATRIKAHVASLNRRTLLSGIMLAEEGDSLQWDDSDFSSALLPRPTLSINSYKPQKKKEKKEKKVPLTDVLSHGHNRSSCLKCGSDGVCVMPCAHFSLCGLCVQDCPRCPRCGSVITGWASVDI